MNTQTDNPLSRRIHNPPAGETEAPRAVSTGTNGAGYGPVARSLLVKLFGVPFLISGAVVGCAMMVVLSFGAPASTQQRSLDDLLLALEASAGRASEGVLLPGDKEHWQAGFELTKRLETKDREFTQSELEATALRLGDMIRAELQPTARRSKTGATPAQRLESRAISRGRRRLDFLVRAIGLTEQPGAVDVLVEVVRVAPTSQSVAAMQQLGNLSHLPGSAHAVGPILERLARASSPEAQLMACTVLSVLADASDTRVIDALAATRLLAEVGEVSWSAALALARLGSAKGKSTLLDLLDRSFWEAENRYQRIDEAGKVFSYQMPPNRVDDALVAAIDATSNLNGDVDLWGMVERLQSDASPVVRQRAVQAVRQHFDRPEKEVVD